MNAVAEQHGLYLAQFSGRPRDGQAWLERLRERAMARFAELGFPTTKDEDWRFTNVAPIVKTAFQPAGEGGPVHLDSVDPKATTLVFVNGRYSPELSRANGGLRAGSLAEAWRAAPEVIERHLGRYASFENAAFVSLNTAFAEDGAFVRIPRNAVIEEPINIVHIAAGGDVPFIVHPRNLIIIGENAQARITESYTGAGESTYFTNAVTEIVACENAVVDHYKLELESDSAFHVATQQVQQGRASNFTSHSLSIGGALVRNDSNTVLDEGSEATLNGLYLCNGRQHIDNHTAIDHAKPHAASHQLYKGVLDGYGSAVFNGKIFVRKDAQKTDAKQTNKNLVLSDNAVINTKPELQIFADDVRCTHGATIGQLDAEAMFYLRSRGLGREQARSLLIYAFAQDIIDRIQVGSLRERLEGLLFERLHAQRQP